MIYPVPDDFKTVANSMPVTALCKHYGASFSRIYRWLRDTGITPPKGYRAHAWNALPMPEGFAEIAPSMTKAELGRHYNVPWDGTIKRWLREAGVNAREYGSRAKDKVQAPGTWRPQLMRGFKSTAERTHSIYDDAADVLRKYGPCYRCGPTGVFSEEGKHWRYGNTVMTPDELLTRAERYRERAA